MLSGLQCRLLFQQYQIPITSRQVIRISDGCTRNYCSYQSKAIWSSQSASISVICERCKSIPLRFSQYEINHCSLVSVNISTNPVADIIILPHGTMTDVTQHSHYRFTSEQVQQWWLFTIDDIVPSPSAQHDRCYREESLFAKYIQGSIGLSASMQSRGVSIRVIDSIPRLKHTNYWYQTAFRSGHACRPM